MDEEKIEMAAELLSNRILNVALSCSVALSRKSELWEELSEKARMEMFRQFTFLFTYITERFSWKILSLEEIKEFIPSLQVKVLKALVENPFIRNKYKEAFFREYNEFVEKYGKYKELTREADKGLGDTLLFEFEKAITKFTPLTDDIRGVAICHAAICGALEELDIKDVLEGI